MALIGRTRLAIPATPGAWSAPPQRGMFAGMAMTANAYTVAEKTFDSGCRAGAHAFEHYTAARHFGYDDNYKCGDIRVYGVRRCAGTTQSYNSGYTSSNSVIATYAGCDALYTRTDARDYDDSYLGSVYSGI